MEDVVSRCLCLVRNFTHRIHLNFSYTFGCYLSTTVKGEGGIVVQQFIIGLADVHLSNLTGAFRS